MYNFELIQIQVAFLDMQSLSQHDRLFYSLNEKLGRIFSEPPIILPFNNMGIQSGGFDAPIVQANSNDKSLSLNICNSRIDIFKSIGKNIVEPDIGVLTKVIDGVANNLPVLPKRIGIVGQYIFKTEYPQKVIKALISKPDCDYSDISFRFARDLSINKNKGKRYLNIQEAEYVENANKFKAVNVSMDSNIGLQNASTETLIKTILNVINECKLFDVKEAYQ